MLPRVIAFALLLGVSLSGPRQGKARASAPHAKVGLAARGVEGKLPIRKLRETSQTAFSGRPPLYALTAVRCDGAGDIFMVYGTALPHPGPGPTSLPDQSTLPISRLSPDSQTITKFASPTPDGYRSSSRVGFSVDRSGEVYALLSARPSALRNGEDRGPISSVVVKFNSDGSVESTAVLRHTPGGWLDIQRIAAFADGSLLATGFLNGPVGSGAVAPFTGIFDSNSRLALTLNLPGDVTPSAAATAVPASPGRRSNGHAAGRPQTNRFVRRLSAEARAQYQWAHAVASSLMVSGPQDTAYLLRMSTPPILYTISSDGQVLHHVRVNPPISGAEPTDMSRAGPSDVAIVYYSSGTDKEGKFHAQIDYAVVDASSGKTTAAYTLPKGARPGAFACATSASDFLFVGATKSGKLAVFTYSGD